MKLKEVQVHLFSIQKRYGACVDRALEGGIGIGIAGFYADKVIDQGEKKHQWMKIAHHLLKDPEKMVYF